MTQTEYESFINEHFSFKWTITDDLYLNLRLVTHKEHCDTYFLFPLFNTNIKRFLKEKDISLVPDDAIELMIAIVTFYDRSFFDLTEMPFMKAYLQTNDSSKNFIELKDFTKKVIVKTLQQMTEKMNLDQEFLETWTEYAKFTSRYNYYKTSFKTLVEGLINESSLLEDGNYFQQLLYQSIEIAISTCETISLENYENILKMKVDRKIATNGLLHINELLNDIGINNKKFAKIKTYTHALDFVANDEIYCSPKTKKEIFKSFTEGLINGYLSLAIINSMNSNDIVRMKNYENVLNEFKENNIDTLEIISKLIKLHSTKPHKQYLPIISLSNAFFGLSEPKVIALSKYILPSVNKKTIKTKFEYFDYIDFELEL